MHPPIIAQNNIAQLQCQNLNLTDMRLNLKAFSEALSKCNDYTQVYIAKSGLANRPMHCVGTSIYR